MSKLFLYDPASVTRDTLTVLNRKGYTCTPLTDDPAFFWVQLTSLDDSSIFVLLSHGNNEGPLPVKGDEGEDIDLDVFAKLLVKKNLTLYLLSCHTGQDPCGATLSAYEALQFVAPKGYAVFQTVGSEVVNVFSKEGDKYPGWTGPLSPSRAAKPVSLP